MRISSIVLTGLLALVSTISLRAHPADLVTLVKAGRLLDPRSGNVIAPAFVLVEDDKIKQVGTVVPANVPEGAKVIDLGNATLLPGLIDGHTHLLLDVVVPPEAESRRHENGEFSPGLLLAMVESPSKRILMGAQSAREDL
jgi:imidazolonepropionase-like amidohydrolase